MACVALPQAQHLGAGSQQLLKRASRFHMPILQHDDLVGATQRRPPVAHHQAGDALHLSDALPQDALGLYIQRAREVIHYQQLRIAHEHARRGRALYLPARELDAPRAYYRVQTLFQFG